MKSMCRFVKQNDKKMKTTIQIQDIKNPRDIEGKGGVKNMYKGAYKKIFSILNSESIFVDAYSDEEFLVGNDLTIVFGEYTINANELEQILKIKNVKLI